MKSRSLILGTLFLTAPLAAQEACQKATECCATGAAQVVQVLRVQPAARALTVSRMQEAAPLPVADLFGVEGTALPVALVSVDRGYLGVRLSTDEEGMRILEVLPGSGAAEAGLQAGDRILTVAGTSTTEASVQEVLQGLEAGDKVKLTYDRAKTRKAKVTLKTLAAMEGVEEEIEFEEIEEVAEIEWIENVEQDLAEEIAEFDGEIVALDVLEAPDGAWAVVELPEAAADDRGYLGVSLDGSGDALTILDVYDGSAAEEAGLQAGDVLLQFDGRKGGPEDQLEYMRGKKIGDKVQVRYRRGDDVGRTRIALGPLNRGVATFGFLQGGPGIPERTTAVPRIRWVDAGEAVLIDPNVEVNSDEIREYVRHAVEDAGQETGNVWITTRTSDGESRSLLGGDGEQRVRVFTAREGGQLRVEAIVEEDEHEHGDHDHEHGDHAQEHGDHEHGGGDHEEIVIGVDARAFDARGGGVQQFTIRHDDDDLHTREGHAGGIQRRVVVKRIADGEETVEDYVFAGDDDDLPAHIRELLHRHAGDHDAVQDEPQRLPRRAAIGIGGGREGNRMIFVPEGGGAGIEVEDGGRIQWTERSAAALGTPRRPAAIGQERVRELQRRVRELERRIQELERAIEQTAPRPRERRIRRER